VPYTSFTTKQDKNGKRKVTRIDEFELDCDQVDDDNRAFFEKFQKGMQVLARRIVKAMKNKTCSRPNNSRKPSRLKPILCVSAPPPPSPAHVHDCSSKLIVEIAGRTAVASKVQRLCRSARATAPTRATCERRWSR